MRNDLVILVEAVAGSRLYGTNRPDSDTDIRGVALAPPGALIGLDSPFEQLEQKAPQDRTIWELRKFIRLAAAGNPNILDTLFTPPRLWIQSHPRWRAFYDCRHAFLSQRVRATYAGYARSQLQRMQGHVLWLNNPPDEPDVNQYGAYDSRNQWRWHSQELAAEYQKLNKAWTHYQEWLANRNPERHALEVSYGYDTKHGSHLARLLLQGRQILETGDFSPVLSGQQLLFTLDVLHGKLPYVELIDWSRFMFDQLADVATTLPIEPDLTRVGELVENIYAAHIVEQRRIATEE